MLLLMATQSPLPLPAGDLPASSIRDTGAAFEGLKKAHDNEDPDPSRLPAYWGPDTAPGQCGQVKFEMVTSQPPHA